MKTQLIIDVEYDPDITDPESLASAVDCLMKTACSTPGILDDYGNPVFGEFFVHNEKQSSNQQYYVLDIGATMFQSQRMLLQQLYEEIGRLRLDGLPIAHTMLPGTEATVAELLCGLINLTDAIADQAFEKYGLDCLLDGIDCL